MLTAEQLEIRKTGIGGSDAGAILGLNPWRSPLEVYLEKTGQADPPDLTNNEAVHWGNRLEDVIAEEYVRRTGHKVRRRNATLRHPEHEFMLAHLDRTVDGERMVLECKTAGQYMSGSWGEPGTDQVPDSYLVQIAHYMIVSQYDRADLAVLIGGRDFRIYHFTFDDELADMLIERERKFWRGVQAGIPPDPVNARDLETLFAQDNGEALVATDELYLAVAELREIRQQGKELKGQEDMLAMQIKAALGEHSHLVDTAGQTLATWKKAKDSQRLDGKRLQKEQPDLYSQYLTTTAGSRRFLLK